MATGHGLLPEPDGGRAAAQAREAARRVETEPQAFHAAAALRRRGAGLCARLLRLLGGLVFSARPDA